MYLITRTVSAYSYNTPLIIGVFGERYVAEQSRLNYLEATAANDPFAEQAYHTVDLERDVEVVEVETAALPRRTRTAYLLITIEEGFGQVRMEMIFLTAQLERAQAKAKAAENHSKIFPCRTAIIALRMNRLVALEDQQIQLDELTS